MKKILILISILKFSLLRIKTIGLKKVLTDSYIFYKENGFLFFYNRLKMKSLKEISSSAYKFVDSGYYQYLQSVDSKSIHFREFEKHEPLKSVNKIITFYLPQFHPFEENDKFWGKGFTEWTNVTKSWPRFLGHYQPRLPKDLGFYDLRLKTTLKGQIEIAKNYGIYGFCFHYYWFSGLKVMDGPISILLSNPDLDMHFCLCWANENWTRRWDGNESDILLKQLDKPSDYLEFIKDISIFFKDNRYIKINGAPVLIIYRAELLKDPIEASKVWRSYTKDLGYPDIYLIFTESFEQKNPLEIGFDAAVDFAPNKFQMKSISAEQVFFDPDFRGDIYQYSSAVSVSLLKKRQYPFYQSLCLGWDNSARKGGKGTILHGCDPETFSNWLTGLFHKKPLNDIIFINAWNEWAEGTYLEPDRRFGFAYLQKCYEGLQGSAPLTLKGHNKRAIYVHVHYFEIFLSMLPFLKDSRQNYDFIFSITTNINDTQLEEIRSFFSGALIERVENKGRDILPFYKLLKMGIFDKYELVCKIHTKKSPHIKDGEAIGLAMVKNLLDCEVKITELKDGAVIWSPVENLKSISDFIGSNKLMLNKYSKNWSKKKFVAGTMFWFSPKIKEVLISRINPSLFDNEPIPYDGTYAHAVERLIGVWLSESSKEICAIND